MFESLDIFIPKGLFYIKIKPVSATRDSDTEISPRIATSLTLDALIVRGSILKNKQLEMAFI
jgi:hypothetical protein